jgi:hypothetical protein
MLAVPLAPSTRGVAISATWHGAAAIRVTNVRIVNNSGAVKPVPVKTKQTPNSTTVTVRTPPSTARVKFNVVATRVPAPTKVNTRVIQRKKFFG